jgi:putative phosphoesterase
MILGVLSDTHISSPDRRFESLLSGVLGPAEILLHVGDYVGEAVVDHLEFADSRPFYGVAGNMDAGGITRRLATKRVLELGGCRIGLVHGWGGPRGLEDRVLATFEETLDVLVFGHSHQATRTRQKGTLLVNPGSAFDRRFAPRCTVALIEISSGDIRVRIEGVGS